MAQDGLSAGATVVGEDISVAIVLAAVVEGELEPRVDSSMALEFNTGSLSLACERSMLGLSGSRRLVITTECFRLVSSM